MTITETTVDIATPTGPMRCMVLRPAEEGRKFPGLVLAFTAFHPAAGLRFLRNTAQLLHPIRIRG